MTSRATSKKTASAARKKKATKVKPKVMKISDGTVFAQTLQALAHRVHLNGIEAGEVFTENVKLKDGKVVTRVVAKFDIRGGGIASIESVNPG